MRIRSTLPPISMSGVGGTSHSVSRPRINRSSLSKPRFSVQRREKVAPQRDDTRVSSIAGSVFGFKPSLSSLTNLV